MKTIQIEDDNQFGRLVSKRARILTFVCGWIAVVGNPWWILADHSELSRTALSVDYFVHGFATAMTIVCWAVWRLADWIDQQ